MNCSIVHAISRQTRVAFVQHSLIRVEKIIPYSVYLWIIAGESDKNVTSLLGDIKSITANAFIVYEMCMLYHGDVSKNTKND